MTDMPTYKELEERLNVARSEIRKFRALHNAATAIVSNLSFEDVIESVVDQIIDALDAAGCTIELWHRERNEIGVLIDKSKKYPDKTEKPGKTYDLKEYPTTLLVLETGQPVQIQVDDETADKAEISSMREMGVFSLLMVPLIVRTKVLGLLEIFEDVESREYTHDEIRLAESLASQGAVAIENSLLYKEQKRTEKTLRASEQKFKNIIHESPMGIHLYELKENDRLVFTGANSASDRLFGVDHMQFIGKTIEEAFPGLIDTEVPERYRDAAKNGVIWSTEQIDYDEGLVSGAFEVVAFQTEPGKMAVFFNEITKRVKAQADLKESEVRFRTLVEKSPFGISLIGENGDYKYINPQFYDMFGYSIEDIPTGAVWFKKAFPDKDYRQKVMEAWVGDKKGTKVGQTRPRTYKVTCKNGSQKTVYFMPVTMENLEQFVIFEDITEKSRMERKLHQAQKFKAIGTLAGGIAHDFNNLLMGIQGRSSLVAVDMDTSHPHFEHLEAIEEYINSATHLTKQLLGFARGGKYEVKPVNINNLVLNSAAMFSRTRKEIKTHTKMHPSILVVEADQNQIEQVLLNMYLNACQAMSDSGDLYLESKTVELDDEYCEPYQLSPGHYVKVSITDTGTGMSEATRLRIFDPFFTTKEKSRGTGLGLASAYGIIKNHRGLITVYSEYGHGTTFNIYLPVSEKDIHQELVMKLEMVKGSETILLVDDEPMIIEIGKEMLEKLGYSVVVAQGGLDAVEKITGMGNEIDMVVLDLIMPEMDGGKTFDRIREIQPEIPVMLSSGYAINGQATEIMRRGCNGFIQKPFTISEISQKIRKVLIEAKRSTQKK